MISILMPIYNGIEFIAESVNSVMQQTYPKWELIIAINGHPHNSPEYQIARKYGSKQIKVMQFTEGGKSITLNAMLAHARYPWIAILDVDDIWRLKKLQHQLAYIGTYDVIGTRCRYFGDKDLSPPLPVGNISRANFMKVNPIINSSALVKKELCYWEPTLEGAEDYDLWLRLWREGKRFYNVRKKLVLHRIHAQSAFNAKGNDKKAQELLALHRARYGDH